MFNCFCQYYHLRSHFVNAIRFSSSDAGSGTIQFGTTSKTFKISAMVSGTFGNCSTTDCLPADFSRWKVQLTWLLMRCTKAGLDCRKHLTRNLSNCHIIEQILIRSETNVGIFSNKEPWRCSTGLIQRIGQFAIYRAMLIDWNRQEDGLQIRHERGHNTRSSRWRGCPRVPESPTRDKSPCAECRLPSRRQGHASA